MNILIGVTGGIAAYKAADLISALKHTGNCSIRVVMTQKAKEFITPLTLSSLSNTPIYDDDCEWAPHGRIDHIRLAEWADVFVIAPATANTIAKFANGTADNLLTSIYSAYSSDERINKKCIICPAMNNFMYSNNTTRKNLDVILQRLNHIVVGPVAGLLACGSTGMGKLAPTKDIIKAILGDIEHV